MMVSCGRFVCRAILPPEHLYSKKGNYRGQLLFGDVFAEFDVPVGEVEEVFPTVVLVEAEIDLDEGAPFGALGLADEMEAGFLGRVVGLAGVTGNAGADDIFPGGGAAAVARDDVVEVQIFPVEDVAAVLAGVVIALEDVVAGELDFLLRETIKDHEQDDAGDADFERDGADAFGVGLLGGEILPLAEAIGLKGTVLGVENDMGVTFKEQGEGPTGGADVDRLPQAVEHQHMLV